MKESNRAHRNPNTKRQSLIRPQTITVTCVQIIKGNTTEKLSLDCRKFVSFEGTSCVKI